MTEKRKIIYVENHYRFKKNKDGERVRIDYIDLKDADKNKIRSFIRDDSINRIYDFEKQKSANEKAIREYYIEQSDEEYNFKILKESNKRITNIIENNENQEEYIREKIFKNENKIISSNKFSKFDYKYFYICVKVKIFFDGFYTFAFGYSNHFSSEKYPDGLSQNELRHAIYQATMAAIAPYGSNVKFSIINWYYIYKQVKGLNFDYKVSI